MPLSLSGIRQKYPEYKDLSDKQLLDGLHSKFYSDMPRAAFDEKLGVVEPSIMGAGQPDQQVGQQVDQQEPQTAPQQTTQDGMLSPLGQEVMGGISSAAGAVPKVAAGLGVGAIQGAAQAGYGLGDLETKLMNKILGTQMEAPKPDVYVGPAAQLKGTIPARIGEAIGQYGPALEAGAGMGRGLLGKALTTGAAAFATQPGGIAQRGLAAAGTAGTGAAFDLLGAFPKMFVGRLAKNLEDLHAGQNNISKELYKTAFKGTDHARPYASRETMQGINDLIEMNPGKRSFINKSLGVYQENPTLKNLNSVRSDLLRETRILNSRKDLDSFGRSTLDLMRGEQVGDTYKPGVTEYLRRDIQKNMNNVSPLKGEQYSLAQQHYRHNVVPFKTYKSLRDLLKSSEKEISPRLYTDLSRHATSANKLRELLGVGRSPMQMGRFIHARYFGLPAPFILGGGLYGIRHQIKKVL